MVLFVYPPPRQPTEPAGPASVFASLMDSMKTDAANMIQFVINHNEEEEENSGNLSFWTRMTTTVSIIYCISTTTRKCAHQRSPHQQVHLLMVCFVDRTHPRERCAVPITCERLKPEAFGGCDTFRPRSVTYTWQTHMEEKLRSFVAYFGFLS